MVDVIFLFLSLEAVEATDERDATDSSPSDLIRVRSNPVEVLSATGIKESLGIV